jgi:hypothetical protein
MGREIFMADIIDKIMAEIESDPTIDAREISLDISSKGFLKRRRLLNVNGMVQSTAEKARIVGIVQRQAGDSYDVTDKLVVT